MFLIVHTPSGETVASFAEAYRAQDFYDAIRDKSKYQLFAAIGSIGDSDHALRNKTCITNDLAEVAVTQKIRAIKLYRAIYGVGLVEAKNAIENAVAKLPPRYIG